MSNQKIKNLLFLIMLGCRTFLEMICPIVLIFLYPCLFTRMMFVTLVMYYALSFFFLLYYREKI